MQNVYSLDCRFHVRTYKISMLRNSHGAIICFLFFFFAFRYINDIIHEWPMKKVPLVTQLKNQSIDLTVWRIQCEFGEKERKIFIFYNDVVNEPQFEVFDIRLHEESKDFFEINTKKRSSKLYAWWCSVTHSATV